MKTIRKLISLALIISNSFLALTAILGGIAILAGINVPSVKELEESIPDMEESLKVSLLPTDPNDERNIIVEVRAGTGGDEAALFA